MGSGSCLHRRYYSRWRTTHAANSLIETVLDVLWELFDVDFGLEDVSVLEREIDLWADTVEWMLEEAPRGLEVDLAD